MVSITYVGQLQNFRVGEEHLVKRRVAIHLLERLHVDTGLLHIDHEIPEPLVLGRVSIGAGEQETVVAMMRAGRLHLLSVDDPKISLQISARGGAGEIGTAARLTEKLAPGIFPGENTAKELFFCRSDPSFSRVAAASNRIPELAARTAPLQHGLSNRSGDFVPIAQQRRPANDLTLHGDFPEQLRGKIDPTPKTHLRDTTLDVRNNQPMAESTQQPDYGHHQP